MNDRRRAFHEAGHATVILALKCATLMRVSIKTVFRCSGGRISWGSTYKRWHVIKPLPNEDEDNMRDRVEDEYLTFLAAGNMSEKLFLEPGNMIFKSCDDSDAERILDYGFSIGGMMWKESVDYRMAMAKARAADILETQSEKVKTIATALMEKKVLSGKEVRAIYNQ